MNAESVMEFLSGVPLLQKLPRFSIFKIAQLVTIKTFGHGELVVREGEEGDGTYFIVEGEAQVSLVNDSRPEFILKRHDYFGSGVEASSLHANVIALTKLTCLILPHEHSTILQPKSIWSAEQASEASPVVEKILQLEPVDVNIFKGITLPDAPAFGKVYGGQFIGQALAAASKTVDCLKNAHSLHAYFLLAGDLDIPIKYQVDRIRDGKSFATRRVEAIQKGKVVFSLLASFQKDEQSFHHQTPTMPSVPDPDTLSTNEELRERHVNDPRLPRIFWKSVAFEEFVPWPLDVRFCEPSTGINMMKSPPSLRFWFRAKGKLSDDQALHRCVLAYTSDLIFLQVSMYPHCREGLRIATISLDHGLWFHRPCKADDWILFNIESPTACNGRGFVSGQMFDRKGQLIASVCQEGVFRRKSDSSNTSKL